MRNRSPRVERSSPLLQGILALSLVALAVPGSSLAQIVEGTLKDREEETRIEGALVLLVDANGRELAGTLSDEEGVYELVVPVLGSFRLRAVRIGYRTLLSEPFSILKGDTVVVHLETSKEAIPIRGIEVKGTQRCRVRPEEGLAAARVWAAVEKALTSQTWNERVGLFRFEVLLHNRDLDSRARRTESEEMSGTEIVDEVPMLSLPAETLVAEGFVRQLDSGGFEFFAPDAEVLLSNAFLNTHCLKLTDHEDSPSLIGLAFEPAKETDVPDIEGTLWVDRSTGHLRFLDFGYTWVPFNKGRDQAGGRVDFDLLPGGAWIIRRWWIRMPTVERMPSNLRRGVSTTRLVGFKETGAEVKNVTRVIR